MLALFAQAARRDRDRDNPFDVPEDMMPVFIAFLIGALIIGLIVAIFYFLTQSKALRRCSPANRAMEPGQVWLNFIPLFNLVWQFITVNRVADSLRNEFRSRGMGIPGDEYGRGLGIAMCALNLAGIIPMIGSVFAIAGFVCFIVYWVKIANYSGQLAAPPEDYHDRRDDDEPRRGEHDDGYEDRPWERR